MIDKTTTQQHRQLITMPEATHCHVAWRALCSQVLRQVCSPHAATYGMSKSNRMKLSLLLFSNACKRLRSTQPVRIQFTGVRNAWSLVAAKLAISRERKSYLTLRKIKIKCQFYEVQNTINIRFENRFKWKLKFEMQPRFGYWRIIIFHNGFPFILNFFCNTRKFSDVFCERRVTWLLPIYQTRSFNWLHFRIDHIFRYYCTKLTGPI